MYTIYIDDALLFSTGLEDDEHVILSPTLSLDINETDSLTFTMPPGHVLYDAVNKMKSIVTVLEDGVMLFRGRVLESERDIYNQKKVYCEGDLSFLLDSLWEDKTVSGKVQGFFRQLIENHNKQVEKEKQFTVGVITAVGEDEAFEEEQRTEAKKYGDTQSVINERLMSVYGGYLRTRTEGGVHYIDWIKEFDEECTQPIRFGVNLLDLKEKVDAGDVFTCLIPLGYSEIGDDGTYTDPVDITSVNGGRNYIQDDDAVALYGKIWRSKTWGSTKDPAQLLKKAKEHMKTGAALQTLTLTAVDMHFDDGDVQMIRKGTKVHIDSGPHGIDLKKVCAKIDIDLMNPEKTPYTFGEPPKTLSEGVIRAEKEVGRLTGSGGGGGGGGGGKSVQEEVQEIIRWAKVSVDNANANINLNAGEISKIDGRVTQAEIDIDGLNSEITLKADKITLEGYVTMSEFEAEIANVKITDASYVTTAALSTQSLDANNIVTSVLTVGDNKASWKSATVVTGISYTTRYAMAPSGETSISFKEYTGKDTETIYYLGHS